MKYIGFNEKKVTYVTPGATSFGFKGPYLWRSDSLLRSNNQIGNSSLSFALFGSLTIFLIYQKF